MVNCKKIKDDAILRYMSEVDFDGDPNEVILLHLSNGDLNDIYTDSIINKLEDKDREELLNTVNKYTYLCFKDGDYLKYTKSVDTPINDKDVKFGLILDNYEFLVKLAYKNLDIVKELNKFKNNSEFNKTSVINTIRFKFNDDNKLIDSMTNFINTDKLYNIFEDDDRAYIYLNPNTLYDKGKMRTSLDLAVRIYNYSNKKRLSSNDVLNKKELFDEVCNFINSRRCNIKQIIDKI